MSDYVIGNHQRRIRKAKCFGSYTAAFISGKIEQMCGLDLIRYQEVKKWGEYGIGSYSLKHVWEEVTWLS